MMAAHGLQEESFEGTAQHMTGRATRDREVHHLGSENERCQHAHQRGGAFLQRAIGLANCESDGDPREDVKTPCHGCTEESIWNMEKDRNSRKGDAFSSVT